MNDVSVLLDFTKEIIDPVVVHHNDEITLAFYQGENLILQVKINKDNVWNLPDMLLKNMGCQDTEELGEECNKLAYRNEELESQIEEYENNLQEYKDKLVESCGPF